MEGCSRCKDSAKLVVGDHCHTKCDDCRGDRCYYIEVTPPGNIDKIGDIKCSSCFHDNLLMISGCKSCKNDDLDFEENCSVCLDTNLMLVEGVLECHNDGEICSSCMGKVDCYYTLTSSPDAVDKTGKLLCPQGCLNENIVGEYCRVCRDINMDIL